MMGVVESFSNSYAQAREKFLGSARAAGLDITSYEHPLKGRDGETLAMDVARDGPADATRVLLVSSACHGVEGYCGTGVQVFALHDQEWREMARNHGVTVVYIHALNPHGFSYVRRVTQENVDLNRNFHDFSKPLPVNEAYRPLHPLLLPAQWPPSGPSQQALAAFIQTHGMGALQAAVSRGQQEFADGLFFGGKAPTWSNHTLRRVLREYGAKAQRIGWIDIHTGLGPNGLGERIYAGPDDTQAVARTRAWWGGDGATPVTSIYDGSSSSAYLTGLMWNSVAQECPQAEHTGIAMEYGTEPMDTVMTALRGDHWLHQHPEAAPELAGQIKQDMLRAFYTDTDVWKGQVIAQARQSLFQGVQGLVN